MSFWVTLIIVAITYLGIAIGRWPLLRANRTTITLMGVGLLLVTGQVQFEQMAHFVDADTIILLFSMMIINANLQFAGFFSLAGRSLLRMARTPRTLLAAVILLSGVLSALFLNDTICLMFTPFILEITQSARRNPIPYLIALATAANIGSAATLTGNPQNMIIGVASGISYGQFALSLLPISLLGLGSIWLVLILFYRWEFRPQRFEESINQPIHIEQWQLTKTLLVVIGMLIAFLVGVPIALAAFLAACVLLLTRRIQPETVFYEINWGLLVFFAALFVVTGSLEANGVAQQLFALIKLGPQTGIWSFSLATTLLSNLVSNVPAVLLLKPVITSLTNPTAGWLALAAASTLAGNLTLLGSVANLIVAEIAARSRVALSFWEYTRAGIVITLISLTIGIVWMDLFIW